MPPASEFSRSAALTWQPASNPEEARGPLFIDPLFIPELLLIMHVFPALRGVQKSGCAGRSWFHLSVREQFQIHLAQPAVTIAVVRLQVNLTLVSARYRGEHLDRCRHLKVIRATGTA